MRVSRSFVILFLTLFLLILAVNITSIIMNSYHLWMAVCMGVMIFMFSFFLFRKNRDNYKAIAAFALSFLFVLVVIYFVFLPIGFHKDYTILVGDRGSVFSGSSEVWLEDAEGNIIKNVSNVYDYGQINLVAAPRVYLKNASVNVSVLSFGKEVYFAKPDFNFENYSWDYVWNFTEEMPDTLNGSAKYDADFGCVYFNSSKNQTLTQAGSSNMFEKDSFAVYLEWAPENFSNNQQIIGHQNWEIVQNNDSVVFSVGYKNNSSGEIFSVLYPIEKSFFNSSHKALAVYSTDLKNSTGYIELYIDGNFVGMTKIYNKNLLTNYKSFGDLVFGNNSYSGCVYLAAFKYVKLNHSTFYSFNSDARSVKVPILGKGKFSELHLSIEK